MTKATYNRIKNEIEAGTGRIETIGEIDRNLKHGHLDEREASELNRLLEKRMINYSVRSLTKRISELTRFSMPDVEEIKDIIKKEMGNYYTSSRLCFTIEDSVDIIYHKIEEDREKFSLEITNSN